MGAKIDLNYAVLDALLQFKTTKKFCADYMGVSERTIDNKLKKDHKMTFTEYHALKLDRTAYKLQQKAIDMALSGNTAMMIFSLKNLAGWSDNAAELNSEDKPLIVEVKRAD